MKPADRLTPETIRELLATQGPCVTIVLAGNETGDTAIEFKSALSAVRKQLAAPNGAAAGGCTPDRIDDLLAPIGPAAADFRGETKSKGNVVILRAPSLLRIFRAGRSVKPVSRAAERLDVRTLLQIRNGQKSFYILALSQNRTRLLECTESSSREVTLPGVPTSLAESRQSRKPDHVLDNRITGGPSIGSGTVMFGTSSDLDSKDQYLLHFFAALEKAVSSVLRDSSDPLIAAGVEHEIALYKRVNAYPHLIEPGIHGAPDGVEGGELHRRAIELLDERQAESGTEVPADFDKRVGTGHASIHIQEIVAAAWEGRISHLYFQQTASYMGSFDPVRNRVKRTDDPLDSPADLIESAAEQAILRGGEARILPASAMPNGVPVCALMRYPAAASAESAA